MSLHDNNNENTVKAVNFATSKMYCQEYHIPHSNIGLFTMKNARSDFLHLARQKTTVNYT